jgi:hypothetical protein
VTQAITHPAPNAISDKVFGREVQLLKIEREVDLYGGATTAAIAEEYEA